MATKTTQEKKLAKFAFWVFLAVYALAPVAAVHFALRAWGHFQ